MIDKFTIGLRIRQLRENKKFTQLQFAELIDKSSNEVSNIETGKVKPQLETLISISKALDVSLDYLVSEKDTFDKQLYIHEIVDRLSSMEEHGVKHILAYIEFYKEDEYLRTREISKNA